MNAMTHTSPREEHGTVKCRYCAWHREYRGSTRTHVEELLRVMYRSHMRDRHPGRHDDDHDVHAATE